MSADYGRFAAQIAGDVVTSDNPGEALRRWRERIAVSQVILAREMVLSPSVLSDYETGRRASPGVGFVRKYVYSLVRLDQNHKRLLLRELSPSDKSAILSIGEFEEPIKAKKILSLVSGFAVVGKENLDDEIYGYTVLDSIKTIYALSGFEFYKIFGASTERALIFTKVGLGRSPMVAIRVGHLKPRMVILHGPKEIDEVGRGLAERERIILALAGKRTEEQIIQALSALVKS